MLVQFRLLAYRYINDAAKAIIFASPSVGILDMRSTQTILGRTLATLEARTNWVVVRARTFAVRAMNEKRRSLETARFALCEMGHHGLHLDVILRHVAQGP